MKKVLLATTFLALGASYAAAEVTVGGDGRMGIVYNGDDWNFSSRVRVKFTLSGETDGGLTFGGSIRADNASNGSKGAAGNVYISGAFGKLSMGDVVGAAEAALFDLPEVGFTDLGNNDTPFLTGDGNLTAVDNPVLLYQYTMGDLSFYASLSDGRLGKSSIKDDQEYAIAVSYAFGDYSVGLGYEVMDSPVAGFKSANQVTLGGKATFGSTTVSAYYANRDGGDFYIDGQAYGLGVESKFGAFTVRAFAQAYDYKPAGVKTETFYGIGGIYDLGGGASLVGGIADNDIPGTKAVADFGIKMTF